MRSGTRMVIDGPNQIIAVGDSLTAGSQPGVTEYAPFMDPEGKVLLRTAYPYILSGMLSSAAGPCIIRNLGRSGSSTREWLPGSTWRKRGVRGFALNGNPLDEIMESREDLRVCLMMLGTNDVNSSVTPAFASRLLGGVTGYEDEDFLITRDNLIVTLENIGNRGIVTYLAKIPPNMYSGGLFLLGLDRFYFTCRSVRERLCRYTGMVNQRIEDILVSRPDLARRGPDFHHWFNGRRDVWNEDHLHLNALGYRLMALAWCELLRSEGIEIRI